MTLHATDRVGQQALKVIPYASGVAYDLLVVRSGKCSAEQRQEAMVRLAASWPLLCREITTLLELAPRSAQQGQAIYERTQDFMEARR
jgi:hypothetical protein